MPKFLVNESAKRVNYCRDQEDKDHTQTCGDKRNESIPHRDNLTSIIPLRKKGRLLDNTGGVSSTLNDDRIELAAAFFHSVGFRCDANLDDWNVKVLVILRGLLEFVPNLFCLANLRGHRT